MTRTSLPGGAVVASVYRWVASRNVCADFSCTFRSTPGRHDDVPTVGSANSVSSTSAGSMDISSTIVTPRRTIQPSVAKTDMYMWSSTKTWLRSTESRSR